MTTPNPPTHDVFQDRLSTILDPKRMSKMIEKKDTYEKREEEKRLKDEQRQQRRGGSTLILGSGSSNSSSTSSNSSSTTNDKQSRRASAKRKEYEPLSFLPPFTSSNVNLTSSSSPSPSSSSSSTAASSSASSSFFASLLPNYSSSSTSTSTSTSTSGGASGSKIHGLKEEIQEKRSNRSKVFGVPLDQLLLKEQSQIVNICFRDNSISLSNTSSSSSSSTTTATTPASTSAPAPRVVAASSTSVQLDKEVEERLVDLKAEREKEQGLQSPIPFIVFLTVEYIRKHGMHTPPSTPMQSLSHTHAQRTIQNNHNAIQSQCNHRESDSFND
jgi:hypothetical protein